MTQNRLIDTVVIPPFNAHSHSTEAISEAAWWRSQRKDASGHKYMCTRKLVHRVGHISVKNLCWSFCLRFWDSLFFEIQPETKVKFQFLFSVKQSYYNYTETDPEHTAGIMHPIGAGNIYGSTRKSWRTFLERRQGQLELPSLVWGQRNPDLDTWQKMDRQIKAITPCLDGLLFWRDKGSSGSGKCSVWWI